MSKPGVGTVMRVRWLDAADERDVEPDAPAYCPIDSVGFYLGEDALYLRLATSQGRNGVDRLIIPIGTILSREWLNP